MLGRTLPLIMLLAALWLGACSSSPSSPLAEGVNRAQAGPRYAGADQHRLQQHYKGWQGAPYRMGGLSRSGIDCSGFVYVTYRDVYGLLLPRSTDELAELGESVDLDEARVGDLLIFKTGFRQRHVGIFIGQGRFIHASTSSGVMTSSVHSDYWDDAFRDVRRVRF